MKAQWLEQKYKGIGGILKTHCGIIVEGKVVSDGQRLMVILYDQKICLETQSEVWSAKIQVLIWH